MGFIEGLGGAGAGFATGGPVGAVLGGLAGLFGGNKAGKAASNQNALADAMAGQYKQYAPLLAGNLYHQIDNAPTYLSALTNRMNTQTRLGAQSSVGNALARLSGAGMLNSGMRDNLLQEIARSAAGQYANNALNAAQYVDERQMRALQALSGLIGGAGSSAAGNYADLSRYYNGLDTQSQNALQALAEAIATANKNRGPKVGSGDWWDSVDFSQADPGPYNIWDSTPTVGELRRR